MSTRDHTTAGIGTLLRMLLKRRFLITVRYRVNFIAQTVSTYLTFAVVFFGGRAAASRIVPVDQLGGTLAGLIVGWFLYVMSMSAFNGLSGMITSESRRGTLEQLYMSPYGFGRVMGCAIVTNVVFAVVFGLVVFTIALLTSGQTLSLNLLTVIAIVVCGLLSISGVGFGFGGLALIYKQIDSVTRLMQYVIILVIAAPLVDVPGARLLPLGQSSAMLQTAMRDGVRLWEFAPIDLGVLIAVAAGYLAVGYAVFHVCSRIARKRGVMGHY